MFGLNPQYSYQTLPELFFSNAFPDKVISPSLVLFNESLSSSLGLNFNAVSSQEKALLFSGNKLPESLIPIAQAYSGHQFGYFTNLGDGRAHLICEHLTSNGQLVDIQLKGSGKTPYSRRGDGRAALGPMLREYIISEAMHALNIPTTRSLAIVLSGEMVYREKALPGAILTRIATSHLRVGTFEYAATLDDISARKKLLQYAILRHYPNILHNSNTSQTSNIPAIDFLNAVMQNQIDLIVHWMRVGFIHGVMNTDNMTISGETIDYGPCAFIDDYEPNAVFSSIDSQGRYAFSNQASVGVWNLARLAESLLPLIHNDQNYAINLAMDILNQFTPLYQNKWLKMMGQKIGFEDIHLENKPLIDSLLAWMATYQADYTNTFLFLKDFIERYEQLNSHVLKDEELIQLLGKEYFIPINPELILWLNDWTHSLAKHAFSFPRAKLLMQKVNPTLIPRNHQLQNVLSHADLGNYAPLHLLLKALQSPYEKIKPEFQAFKNPPTAEEKIYQTFCGT
ncbi:protein adenylyltransferase SelO [Thorsellia kenyensis]|uniref:Protein nucleotidyltransferase YdiU n=1 Tax=Thorsellia kenyensis TaxID=1549888 RepID=A0ABV6CH46_9GAMM